ncbi:FtsK/SpoIIIE domain-containing protein [Bacillus salipaludis]|uniref:FtsK/SpoIIIE domain-containing protein n=1 Tax=Bacillus salipaludis TaxID=2547811 RepID=UPI003D190FA9
MSLWADIKARYKITKAFRAGSIYKTIGTGENEKKIFPKIHSIEITDFSTEYVFTLPTGLNPDLIKKGYYAFQQVFGDNMKLEGESKKYVLTINKSTLPKKLIYNFKKIKPELEGFEMPIVCGVDNEGSWVVYDAVTAPNCLISGEPGAGKSTECRSIISTLIQYKTPEELHLYLGDLKMSEFFLFKDIKHVKSVCVYPEDMSKMLNHLHHELRIRGELLNKHRVDHITKVPGKHPYILLAIDEIVMIMDDKEMKKKLVQICALGRALGIYCMLSLQRPSHDILDTKIRSLLTVRMGFRTTDASNSKIIGTPGSEKISEETPGRFLMKRSEIKELQAPYLTLDKAEELLEAYRVKGWKDMFAKAPISNEKKELTEKDVFNDVNKKG